MSCPLPGAEYGDLLYSPTIRRTPGKRKVLNGRSAGRLLAAACALALAACASGARKPDLTLPAAYEAPAGAAQLSNETLDRWWRIFGDDELDGL